MIFATCDRYKALQFLKDLYPSCEVNEDNTKEILDLVEKDILRVCDPKYHRGSIIGATNFKPVMQSDIQEIIERFNESLFKKENIL